MRAIRKFSLTLAAAAILLVLAVALTSIGSNSSFNVRQSQGGSASAKAALAQSMKTYTMFSGLWRTDGGFVSTIRVKNVLVVAPLDVMPVLFMSDGTPYPLPSVHLAVSGVTTININDALAKAPPSVASHISQFGSAALMHTYTSPGHVSASMAVIDAGRSLSYTVPFIEPRGDAMQQTLDGLWWKHDPGVFGWMALSNVTDAEMQASVQLADAANSLGNGGQPARNIALQPHTTQMFHLEDFPSNPSPLTKQAGGIRVSYTGQPGSVLVTGGLENDAEGYSANIPFWGHDMSSAPATSITYAFAGLMIGKPDPMMMPGFPKDTTFAPYLVLRNTTGKPLDVALQLTYMMTMGGSSTGMNSSAPITRNVPSQHLAPGEAKQVDMQPALSSAGLKNFNGSINLTTTFTGKGGDLALASGSADQTGTYVFEVGAQSTASTQSKFAQYWSTTNGNDTMFTLFNPSNAAQDFVATFHYGDGSGQYVLPVHLEAQASTMIDMAMLIAEHKPDANGNLIPSNIQEGSADFASGKGHRENITLVVDGGIYNVTTATCGCSYVTCCGTTRLSMNPSPMFCPIGDTMQCTPQGVDCNGYTVGLGPGSWSSSNTSIATVDNNGFVTGLAVGSATITYTGSFLVEATGTFCLPEPTCPGGNPVLQDTDNVVDSTPLITGIDPSDWNAGATTIVTFTGQYFGTNAPTLSFSPGAGISYSLSSYNDTQIVASVTVAAGTPNEQVAVSVTNNGYGGNAFNGGSAGESPTSPGVYATVHAPINSPEVTVIAWINGQAPDLATLPGSMNQSLVTNLNSSPSTCGRELFLWSVGIPNDLHSSDDQTYANDWLIKFSANPAPPSSITPSAQRSAGNFRMMNDFGKGSGFYQLGITPDPCGTSVPKTILNWIGQGQSSQYNGASGTSPSGKVYQVGEGRIGKIGQAVSETINNRTVPWIWSVIEFDSSGNATYSDVGMFPTYYIYVNGALTATYAQSSVASFAAKDQTYQRTPSQIQ